MKKAIPTGVVNYREIRTEGFYCVDKTLLIKEFLARKSKVTLITRPHPPGAQGETLWYTARVHSVKQSI